jgi:hypothetical protein
MDKLKHSRLGIISTVMGVIGFFVTFILIALAAFLYRQEVYEGSIVMIFLGLFIFADIIFLAAGAAVGLAGFFNTYKRKTLCIFGMLFNISIMAALILLLMAGLKP